MVGAASDSHSAFFPVFMMHTAFCDGFTQFLLLTIKNVCVCSRLHFHLIRCIIYTFDYFCFLPYLLFSDFLTAVLLVGYGTEKTLLSEKPYWLVKNR